MYYVIMRIVFLSLFMLMLSGQCCYAQNYNNGNDFDAIPDIVKNKLQEEELSEIIWDVEMADQIEREFGSSESSYYNNRGQSSTYSDDIGGDSFNTIGY